MSIQKHKSLYLAANDPHAFGYAKVACVAPRLKVADTGYNAGEIVKAMKEAGAAKVDVLLTPELSLTGYTCGDLFHHAALLDGALQGLETIRVASQTLFDGIVFVGMPLVVDDRLFNCAVAVGRGLVLGVVPKTYLPNYKEFYEQRWYASEGTTSQSYVVINDEEVPFGGDLIFASKSGPALKIAVDVCEDLWAVIPPSNFAALAGANLIVNLSASNELVGKAEYRRDLVVGQSARLIAAYAYVSSGVDESTTDVVFGGHSLIAENGSLLKEGKRFERDSALIISDIDVSRIQTERLVSSTFGESQRRHGGRTKYRSVVFAGVDKRVGQPLDRYIEAHPFVPKNKQTLDARCEEIFAIQVNGLARRLHKIGTNKVTIGVSGGLDSTLALLVACRAFDLLGLPRSGILGYTLPGFGTTSRTKTNALDLMQELGITSHEVDIRPMCLAQMLQEGHKPFGMDLAALAAETRADYEAEVRAGVKASKDIVGAEQRLLSRFNQELIDLQVKVKELKDLHFENVQARARTKILMDNGFTVGTGDVSELAIGWCTYNGDHMSMYGVNSSVPKTLVKFLVSWASNTQFDGKTRGTLKDIVATEISPELLPTDKDGKIVQKTESVVGPYELVDFFLYHMIRNGFRPEKVLFLARHAKFDEAYDDATLEKWLRLFITRFFNSQFKRSCLPDGPKVGSVSLSPRGDWRMPTDAEGTLWLAWVEHSSQKAGSSQKQTAAN